MDIKDSIFFFLKKHKHIIGVIAYFLVFYIGFVVWKSNNYLQPALDYAYFDQFIWKYSQFKKPIATLGIPINLLGQHLHLILLALAPFYYLSDSPSLLGILDVLIIIAGIIPVYLIAKHYLNNDLQAALIGFLYGNSLGIQFAVDFQFHEITIFMGFFMWAYYFMIQKKWLQFYIFMALCLLCKENIGLYFSFFGVYVFFSQKERKHGIIISIIGTIWLFFALKVAIPYFRGSSYIYFTFNAIGKNPQEFILNSLQNPLILITTLASPIKKLITLSVMFGSGLFLIILSPFLFILTIPMIMERFLNDQPHMWQLSQHYNVSIGLVITLSIIIGIGKIGKLFKLSDDSAKKSRYAIISILLIINISLSFYLVTPYKKMFILRSTLRTDLQNRQSIEKAISTIPKNAPISGISGLISHFSKRDNIEYLPKGIGDYEYIIINYNIKEFWPYKDAEEIKKDEGKIKKTYKQVFSDGLTVIYKKN